MVDSVAFLELASVSNMTKSPSPTQSNIDSFNQMLKQPNIVDESLKGFVESAQAKLEVQRVEVDTKLRDFNVRNDIYSLIDAMHTSSMQSVHVQLTSKIGTKVSENFEQLIKQQ